MPNRNLPRLSYTIQEVAEVTGINALKVRAAIGCGDLPAKRNGPKLFLILERDVRAWLEAMPDA